VARFCVSSRATNAWTSNVFSEASTRNMGSPTAIVAYLALFSGAGFLFLFANLLIGRFLRPHSPNIEKLEVYECGEPTIGSSFVQFDLRFYVVALLFIIFDVEVAFFFPWATVFGKATHLMDPHFVKATADGQLTPGAIALFEEMGIDRPTMPLLDAAAGAGLSAAQQGERAVEGLAETIARFSMIDIGVFFAVLLVGFAYVWKRGDLDWVRALSRQRAAQPSRTSPLVEETEVISA
jgi:NADH-quinone oxidoreductase subunit A